MLLTSTELVNAVGMALDSVRSNKFRSALTILGVMVGVAAVIAITSVVNGLNNAAENEIDQMGSNVIVVRRFAPNTDYSNLSEEERRRPHMTVGEAMAIKDNCPSVDGVAPGNYYFKPGGNEAKYKNRKFSDPSFMGTWPDFARVHDKDLSSGRFISELDEQYRMMVCVLGSDVAATLFPEGDAVGREIRINGDKFEIVGVFEEIKSNFGNDFENRRICVPLSTYQKLIPWEKALGLEVRAASFELIDQALEEVRVALRIYRKVPFNKPDNFALTTQDQFKDQISNITNYLYIAGIVITSVGLMVGGIGVMNIMLVSVTERTREIGVRKAIGAKRTNIILQFLTEAMSLSGIGGIVGIIFGVFAGMGLNALMNFPLSISIFWAVIGFVVSVSVGLVSGVYPAVKAARLDPIDALRYE
ncbi:MAG: FtsX-like permease family protein [bacterium]|nr:FtsX-like permease family protein [bacterium]